METRLPGYDPGVIESFAERLYEKAAAFVAGSIVTGAALGAAFGAVPLTSLGSSWPIPSSFGFATMLVGAVSGAVLGYRVADARSFSYKLQAQSALCQLQIERNTAAAAERVAVHHPVPVPAPAHQAPAPQPTAPHAPAPVPVAPAQPEPDAKPVVVPPDAAATGYATLLRVATPLND
jgi:hypothetical protein